MKKNLIKYLSPIFSLFVLCSISLSLNAQSYPNCSSSASDPDGDGWGWENNQSCIVASTGNGSYPTCSSASSDPDGDGWGWENNQSCIVSASSSSTSSSSSSSSSSGTTGGSCVCNWYGSNYPACNNQTSGWGWENNQSCIGQSTCSSQAGGGGVVCSGGGSSSSSSSSSSSGSSGYPTCASASSDPDGDGWGWENNQSCIVSGGSSGGSSGSGSCGTGSCPGSLSCPSGMSCGCYTVSGLGANKRAYQDAGANRSFLASAMMETERMDTNYAYGDNKTGDAFNAGATKQNWGMMRQCHSAWTGYGANDYAISAQMNSNRSLDVQVYNECRNYFGNNWFAGHRNGSSGLSNPNTTDINNFRNAYNWTYNQLAGHECDDVRFWVDVPAI